MAVIRAFAFVFISSEVVLYIYLWQTVLGWPSWRILKLFSIIACWSFSMCHYKMSGFHNSYPIKFHYCCHFICGNSYQWVFVFFLHPWMSNYIKLFFYSLQAVSYFLHLKRILFVHFITWPPLTIQNKTNYYWVYFIFSEKPIILFSFQGSSFKQLKCKCNDLTCHYLWEWMDVLKIVFFINCLHFFVPFWIKKKTEWVTINPQHSGAVQCLLLK